MVVQNTAHPTWVKQWLVIDEPLRLIREKVGNRHIQGNGGFFTSKGLI